MPGVGAPPLPPAFFEAHPTLSSVVIFKEWWRPEATGPRFADPC